MLASGELETHCSYLIAVPAVTVFPWALSCGRDFTWAENTIFLLPATFGELLSVLHHVWWIITYRGFSLIQNSFYLELSCQRSLTCDTSPGQGKELDLVPDSSSRTEHILCLIPSSVLLLQLLQLPCPEMTDILTPAQPHPALSCTHATVTRHSNVVFLQG